MLSSCSAGALSPPFFSLRRAVLRRRSPMLLLCLDEPPEELPGDEASASGVS